MKLISATEEFGDGIMAEEPFGPFLDGYHKPDALVVTRARSAHAALVDRHSMKDDSVSKTFADADADADAA